MSNSPMVSHTHISPNRNHPRNHRIDKITVHHMAIVGGTVEQCGNVFAPSSRQASSNYGIGVDGRVGLYVDEGDRSWASSNAQNDHRAVTIEVANDGGAPDWHVSDASWDALVELCADICRRNGIDRLVWTGDANGNLTCHYMFAATACPGPYLKGRMAELATAVNAKLGGSAPAPAPQPDPGPQWSCRDLGDTNWTGPAMVSEWQAQLGTKVDGCISGQSAYNAEKVQQAITVSPACDPARGSLMVIALQKRLIALGFDVGPDGADGHMGRSTVKALQAFLNDRLGVGLAVDGTYGHATSRAVGTALQRGLFR